MPKNQHLVLCGSLVGHRGQRPRIALYLHPKRGNVHLEIANLNERLLANIPDALIDLLEIASYVYAADSAISRGGRMDAQMGAQWRRRFRLVIPVRRPALWSSSDVMSPLVETLSFLSEDDYQFEFQQLAEWPATTDYLELPDADIVGFTPDEVVLFSGGLDSFAGAVEEIATGGKKVALVSHRSSPKIEDVQNYLVNQLRARFGPRHILHVPIRMTLDAGITGEYTHRTRSFLFVALGAVTAHLFGKARCCFFENGVTSLNLPPIGQVVGARASRTTHPQALAGFSRLLSELFGYHFEVNNPFVWLTKSEVVEKAAENQCADLIRHTRSCSRVRDMTKIHSHCGECSQCIDRRFAILAAGQKTRIRLKHTRLIFSRASVSQALFGSWRWPMSAQLLMLRT
jgi:7-cyano-7-deazaguanine synthase in queuosine biosynthesis